MGLRPVGAYAPEGLRKEVDMNWIIWLAFGIGLIFGACGMAVLIGFLESEIERLRRETQRWWEENCQIYMDPHAKNLPRIMIGYFKTSSSGAEQ